MASENISRTLKAIITTLCRKNSKEKDAMRRLFQLKYWMLDDRAADLEVFRDAERVYASLAVVAILTAEMRAPDAEREAISASTAIEDLLSDDTEFQEAIDQGFIKGKGFESLDVLNKMSDEQNGDAYNEKLNSLRSFTSFCLRVHAAKRNSVKEDAKKLYALAAFNPESGLRKDIDALRTARRQRLPFLYAASGNCKDVLNIAPSAVGMWALLKEQCSDTVLFQTYFSRCASVQHVMRHGTRECSMKDIEEWAGLASATRKTKPISPQEIKAAEDHHTNT